LFARQIRRAQDLRTKSVSAINPLFIARSFARQQSSDEEKRKSSNHFRRRGFQKIGDANKNSAAADTNSMVKTSVRIELYFDRGELRLKAFVPTAELSESVVEHISELKIG